MILSESRYPLFGIMLVLSVILSENRYPLFGIMLVSSMILPENRYPLFGIMLVLSVILSENRYPLFGIMLQRGGFRRAERMVVVLQQCGHRGRRDVEHRFGIDPEPNREGDQRDEDEKLAP